MQIVSKHRTEADNSAGTITAEGLAGVSKTDQPCRLNSSQSPHDETACKQKKPTLDVAEIHTLRISTPLAAAVNVAVRRDHFLRSAIASSTLTPGINVSIVCCCKARFNLELSDLDRTILPNVVDPQLRSPLWFHVHLGYSLLFEIPKETISGKQVRASR